VDAHGLAMRLTARQQFAVRCGCFHHEDGGAAMVLSVTPAKVYAHANGDPFGAATHRF
jgi:hypothetical protein